MSDLDGVRVHLHIPSEVWECEVALFVGINSPEAEAVVVESVLAYGNLDDWKAGIAGRPPFQVLSTLVDRGVLMIESDGGVTPSPEVENAIEEDDLVEFLRAKGGQMLQFKVVRNLLTGNFHKLNILESDIEFSDGDQVIQAESRISAWNDADLAKIPVAELMRPVSDIAMRETGGSHKEVLQGVRLLRVEATESEIVLSYKWRPSQDGSVHPIPLIDIPLAGWIVKDRLVSGLQPVRPDMKVKREWKLAHELLSLRALERARKMANWDKKGYDNISATHLDNLLFEAVDVTLESLGKLGSEDEQRLDKVRVVVGTENEQWAAVQTVIHSADSNCVLLSAFTAIDFADEAASRFKECMTEGVDLLLLSGEPNRINETVFEQRTAEYGKALRENGSPDSISIKTTTRASHSKFVISDTGKLWIGSCNMLSACPGSWVLETGLLIDDANCAAAVLDHVLTDEWLGPDETERVRIILDTIRSNQNKATAEINATTLEQIGNEMRSLKNYVTNSKGAKRPAAFHNQINSHLVQAARAMRAFAERPRWSLVKTDQHQPLFLSMIDDSRSRIFIGSDAVRPSGLDKSVISRIARRPSIIEDRASKYCVQICWGRQDPNSVKKNDEEMQLAVQQLSELRVAVIRSDRSHGSNLRSLFFPGRSDNPMLTHAKFLQMDDQRLMITSDNLLAFGDDEGWDSDARELGLLIDAPRLARQMRCELELLVPELGMWHDRSKWFGAFATTILDSGESSLSFTDFSEAFGIRLSSSETLVDSWMDTVEGICESYDLEPEQAPFALIRQGLNEDLYTLEIPRRTKFARFEKVKLSDSRLNGVRIQNPEVHMKCIGWSGFEEESNSTEQSSEQAPEVEVPSKAEQLKIMIEAVRTNTSEDGWSKIETVLHAISRVVPGFKVKAWGKKKAIDLFDDYVDTFESMKRETGHWSVRLKR